MAQKKDNKMKDAEYDGIEVDPILMLNAILELSEENSQEFSACSSSSRSANRKKNISHGHRQAVVQVTMSDMSSERFQLKTCDCGVCKRIAEKNALKLIEEEEREKTKAAKKKAKKGRQRQKKETEKSKSAENGHTNSDNAVNSMSNDVEESTSTSDNKETEGLDLRAAFVSNAIKKIKSKEENGINSMIKKASEYEKSEHLKEAVELYSQAIKLAPDRFDLILKRSRIYYLLKEFRRSIRDAQKVILSKSTNNAECYYRIGEANFALKNLSHAEEAYLRLINIKKYHNEAKKRLFTIRQTKLTEMGYNPNEAFTALIKSKNQTIDEAVEFLTKLEEGKVNIDDLYYSDEEESEEEKGNQDTSTGPPFSTTELTALTRISITGQSPELTDPSNPFACCSLYVGNLKEDITYEEVHKVFLEFGDIKTIKLVTEPNCHAFVNYNVCTSAGRAMRALQNSRWLLSNTLPLLIKYPINTVKDFISGMKTFQMGLTKDKQDSDNLNRKATLLGPTIRKPVTSTQRNMSPNSLKISKKSVLGTPQSSEKIECYYWRTRGCNFGNRCYNHHIPEHEFIDLDNRSHFRIQERMRFPMNYSNYQRLKERVIPWIHQAI